MFTSVDPLVVKTMEPYLYASGNPSTYSDPSGLETCRLDANNQPTICFDDYDFYVTQVAYEVGTTAIDSYDWAREESGLIPSTDDVWMALRAISVELRNDLDAFYEAGDSSLDEFLLGAGKGLGKGIVSGVAGSQTAKLCPGFWKAACAAAGGAVAMFLMDAGDAALTGDSYWGAHDILESGLDGALAAGFAYKFSGMTAMSWSAFRSDGGSRLGILKAFYLDPSRAASILRDQAGARATATAIRRAVSWYSSGGPWRLSGLYE